jgi:hypothetical protein
VASLVAALGSTLVFAAPAAAQPSNWTLESTVTCDGPTGKWRIVWKVHNWIRTDPLILSGIRNPDQFRFQATPGGTEMLVDETSPNVPPATGEVVEAYWGKTPGLGWLIQRLPGTVNEAELTFSAGYHGGVGGPNTTTVSFPGRCRINGKPAVSWVHACDGSLTARTSNTQPKSSAVTFTVKAGGGFKRSFQVGAGDTEETLIPAANARGVTVTAGSRKFGPVTWRAPASCGGASAGPEATCPAGSADCSTTPAPAPGVVAAAAGSGAPSESGAGRFGAAGDVAADDSLPLPLLAAGGGGLAILLGVALLLFVLRRRRLAEQTAPIPVPPPYGQQQGYHPWQR